MADPTQLPAIPAVDNFDPGLRKALQPAKEILEVLLGRRGDPLDQVLTRRDMADLELVAVNSNGSLAQGPALSGLAAAPPSDESNYVDMSVPPAVDPATVSLVSVGDLVIIDFLQPAYNNSVTGRSNHNYTEVWRASAFADGTSPSFSAAKLVQTSPGTPITDATGQAHGQKYFYWLRNVSKADVKSALSGGVTGFPVTMPVDTQIYLNALSGALRDTELSNALATRINKIDGPDTLPGSVAAQVKTETTARTAGDTALSQQIALLTAGSGDNFDQANVWYFDTTIEGWGGNGTPTQSAGWLRPANHATDPYVVSPAVSASGVQYPLVKARIRRTGTPTWAGELWYITATDGTYNSAKRVTLGAPTFDGNGIANVTWSMTGAWLTDTVVQIRADLSTNQDASNYLEIDWIAIGRQAPGASAAALLAEQTARVNGDNAVASSVTTLSTTVGGHTTSIASQTTSINGLSAQYTLKVDNNGYLSGFGLASVPVNGTPVSTFLFRADQFYITNPAGPGPVAPSMPFAVLTSSQVIGGETVPAGTYMDSAWIKNGTMTTAKIANLAVATGKMADLAVTTAKIATLAVTDAQIMNLSAAKVTFGTMSGDRISVGTLNGDRIIANTINGNAILANSITANKLTTTNLSSINASVGALSLIDDGAGGAGMLRTYNKSWDHSTAGSILARNPNGDTYVEFVGGSNKFWLSSWGDCGINFNNKFIVDNAGNCTATGTITASVLKANTIMVGTEHLYPSAVTSAAAVSSTATVALNTSWAITASLAVGNVTAGAFLYVQAISNFSRNANADPYTFIRVIAPSGGVLYDSPQRYVLYLGGSSSLDIATVGITATETGTYTIQFYGRISTPSYPASVTAVTINAQAYKR